MSPRGGGQIFWFFLTPIVTPLCFLIFDSFWQKLSKIKKQNAQKILEAFFFWPLRFFESVFFSFVVDIWLSFKRPRINSSWLAVHFQKCVEAWKILPKFVSKWILAKFSKLCQALTHFWRSTARRNWSGACRTRAKCQRHLSPEQLVLLI